MEGVTRVLLVTILMFVKSSISQNCIPLRQCSSLMTLLENKNQLSTQHQVGTIDIFTILRNANCGFEGKDPLVWCQDAEVEDGDEIVDRIVLINRDVAPEFHCAGTLTLMHLDPSQGLGSMKTSRLQGPIYFNIQRRILQSNRKILHLKVDGNCCWKLHTRQNFRGRAEYFHPGHEGTFESFQPKSIKRILCSTVPQLK